MRGAQSNVRVMLERAAGWLVCGPVGHLVAGIADWLELVVRWRLGRRGGA
jgi:hypothetical protein